MRHSFPRARRRRRWGALCVAVPVMAMVAQAAFLPSPSDPAAPPLVPSVTSRPHHHHHHQKQCPLSPLHSIASTTSSDQGTSYQTSSTPPPPPDSPNGTPPPRPPFQGRRPRLLKPTPTPIGINTLLLQSEGNPSSLFHVVEQHVDIFNCINCATALNRLSRTTAGMAEDQRRRLRTDPRLLRLLARTSEVLAEQRHRELCQTVNALAKMGLRDQVALRDALLPALRERMVEYDAQQLANIINGLAKLGWAPGDEFLSAFSAAAENHLMDFTGQGLANLINGMAKLQYAPRSDFMELFSRCVERRLDELTPQGLANIMHGFSRLGYHPTRALLDQIAKASFERMSLFSPVEVSCLALSMAKLEYDPGATFLQHLLLIHGQPHRLHESNGGSLANLAWALSCFPSFSFPDPITRTQTLDALRDSAERQLEYLSSSALAALVQGFVGLRFHPGPLFLDQIHRLGEDLAASNRILSSQDGLAIIYSLTKLGTAPGPQLLSRTLDRLERTDLPRCRARRLKMLTEALVMLEQRGLVGVEGQGGMDGVGGVRPPLGLLKASFLRALVTVIQSQLDGFTDAATLALVVDGLQRLGGADVGELVRKRLIKLTTVRPVKPRGRRGVGQRPPGEEGEEGAGQASAAGNGERSSAVRSSVRGGSAESAS